MGKTQKLKQFSYQNQCLKTFNMEPKIKIYKDHVEVIWPDEIEYLSIEDAKKRKLI